MKIRLFIGLAGPQHGGLQTVCIRLAQDLERRGHDARIIARFAKSQADPLQLETARTFTVEGVDVEIISIQGWRRLLIPFIRRLRHRGRIFFLATRLYEMAFGPTIDRCMEGAELAHYFGHGSELLGYAVRASARRKNIPFVVQPAIHVGQAGDGLADWPLYRSADMVIAHSEFEAETIRQHGINPTHVRAVRLGFDIAEPGDGMRFRKEHGIDGPMILFLGRRAEYKGYFLILEAFAQLRERVPNATLVIAGPGDPLPAMTEGVRDLGHVTPEVKQDALSACTVFCLPSKGESFGIVYFEAWNYGKPVVALDFPVHRETIGASGGGLLAAPDRVGDLVEKLERIIENPGLAAEMGTRGREFSRGYSWSGNADACLEAYEQAVRNQQGGSAA